jgi:nudix-type nucleoside diphosphatase (YffH/AdpP family)
LTIEDAGETRILQGAPDFMTISNRSDRVRVVARRVLYQGFGEYVELDVEQKRADGGTLRLSREFQNRTDVVAVLPYDPDRRVALLARQLRVPLYARGDQDGFLLEAPAGHIDAGEEAAGAARREALEEVGVRLSELEHVADVFTSPGAITERLSLYLAPYGQSDVTHADGGGIADEGEEIEIVEVPLAMLEAELATPAGSDAKTVLLLQALRLRRPELFC